MLVSGVTDKTVKVSDFPRQRYRKCSWFDRCGLILTELFLVTTDHPTICLYNVETAQCFLASAPGGLLTQRPLLRYWFERR
ncbi:hypothetical protein GCK32_020947 [Trichostrongylus colubriformis]|uniref:Uncharacterized protein n=1 Tax=Trichostrongylus colubriformis TaxID=6319 RepID=A0AAN8ES81_TRICO